MKIDAQAQEALQQSDTRMEVIDMTPERKAKFSRISGQIVDFLRHEASGPVEGYMILHFVMKAFEENYGIRGGIVVGNDEVDH